jgi:hypothetical protein
MTSLPERRLKIHLPLTRAATTKHMIEALVCRRPGSNSFSSTAGRGRRARAGRGDQWVYPKCELLDVTPLLRVRDRALRETRFIADAHLGGLAHLLRMTCFDTLYDNHFGDDEIECLLPSGNPPRRTRFGKAPSLFVQRSKAPAEGAVAAFEKFAHRFCHLPDLTP